MARTVGTSARLPGTIVVPVSGVLCGLAAFGVAWAFAGADEALSHGMTALLSAAAGTAALLAWQANTLAARDLEAALTELGYRVEVRGTHVFARAAPGSSNRLGSWNAVPLGDWALAERMFHADGDIETAIKILANAHDPDAPRRED